MSERLYNWGQEGFSKPEIEPEEEVEVEDDN